VCVLFIFRVPNFPSSRSPRSRNFLSLIQSKSQSYNHNVGQLQERRRCCAFSCVSCDFCRRAIKCIYSHATCSDVPSQLLPQEVAASSMLVSLSGDVIDMRLNLSNHLDSYWQWKRQSFSRNRTCCKYRYSSFNRHCNSQHWGIYQLFISNDRVTLGLLMPVSPLEPIIPLKSLDLGTSPS
jgi:hypothetical protein